LREESYTSSRSCVRNPVSKSPRKHSTSSEGEMKLSIRFGQREDGTMFVEYTENSKDMGESNHDTKRAPVTICQQCRENDAEQGSEYCPVCLVMFAQVGARPFLES